EEALPPKESKDAAANVARERVQTAPMAPAPAARSAPSPATVASPAAPPVSAPASAAPPAATAAGAPSSGLARAKRDAAQAASQSGMLQARSAEEAELERIANLRVEGRHDEADKALAEFRRRHPDY